MDLLRVDVLQTGKHGLDTIKISDKIKVRIIGAIVHNK